MTNDQRSISHHIMDEIRKRRVGIRSRRYCVFRNIIICVVVGVTVAFLLVHSSYFLYALRRNGVYFLPSFGERGLGVLIRAFPWIPLLAGIIISMFLVFFVARRSAVYRFPVLYTFLTVLFMTIIGGFLIDQSQLHHAFYAFAEKQHMPIIEQVYDRFVEQDFNSTYIGMVTSVSPTGFTMTNRHGEVLFIRDHAATFNPDSLTPTSGTAVLVLGHTSQGGIEAEGIRVLSDAFARDVRDDVLRATSR